MHLLAEKAGCFVVETGFLSSTFQFCTSELYMADIPYLEARRSKANVEAFFAKRDVKALRKAARRLDEMHDGDSALFWPESKII